MEAAINATINNTVINTTIMHSSSKLPFAQHTESIDVALIYV